MKKSAVLDNLMPLLAGLIIAIAYGVVSILPFRLFTGKWFSKGFIATDVMIFVIVTLALYAVSSIPEQPDDPDEFQ